MSSGPIAPSPLVVSSQDTQLAKVQVSYDSEAGLTDEGISYSRETTVWSGLGPQVTNPTELGLAGACQRAAIMYPGRVSRITLGIIGAVEHDDPPGTAFRVRPFGPNILVLGPLEQKSASHFYYPVTGGLLAVISEELAFQGRLTFQWWREEDREIFETRLIDFRPAIRGVAPRSTLRGFLYRNTQSRAHTIVMWLFHRWVRKHRARLLAEQPRLEAVDAPRSESG